MTTGKTEPLTDEVREVVKQILAEGPARSFISNNRRLTWVMKAQGRSLSTGPDRGWGPYRFYVEPDGTFYGYPPGWIVDQGPGSNGSPYRINYSVKAADYASWIPYSAKSSAGIDHEGIRARAFEETEKYYAELLQ